MDIQKLRNETPGCYHKIHVNNAGCSLHNIKVLNAIKNYLDLESTVGGYEIAAIKQDELNKFYSETAKLLNCESRNIAFAHSATDAFSKALSSIPFKEGDCILTTKNDYVSNQLHFLSLQKRFGIKIIRAENSDTGEVDISSIETHIKKHRPKIISVTHVPSNTGIIQPIEEIGKLCEKHDIIFFVDACQSAGQLSIDVKKIKCDFLSATMRKFMRGPRATGFLYVGDKILNNNYYPLFIDMKGADWTEENEFIPQSDAKRFEYIELSFALLSGATRAIQDVNEIGILEIEERNRQLSKYMRDQLSTIPDLRMLDYGKQTCSIISCDSDVYSMLTLKDELIKKNINTSVALKKFALIDLSEKEADEVLRISPHYYNTFEECDSVSLAIIDILSEFY